MTNTFSVNRTVGLEEQPMKLRGRDTVTIALATAVVWVATMSSAWALPVLPFRFLNTESAAGAFGGDIDGSYNFCRAGPPIHWGCPLGGAGRER